MTCADQNVTFRLVDPWVGWQPDGEPTGLDGITDHAGLRLATVPGSVPLADLRPWFPDPRLAPGCHSGWYLLAVPGGPRLLRRDPCTGGWQPVWPANCQSAAGDPAALTTPLAVAAGGHWLAVLDAGRVLLWDRDGGRLAAVTEVPAARLVAVGRDGRVLVGGDDAGTLWPLDPDGTRRPAISTGAVGRLLGIRIAAAGSVWLLVQEQDVEDPSLWTGRPGDPLQRSDPAALAAVLPASNLQSVWDDGFCLQVRDADGELVSSCTSWSGDPLIAVPSPTTRYVGSGSLSTEWLDSGISRCRWHRVRVDAALPAGSALATSVTVAEQPLAQIDPADWQQAPAGSLDFLVAQPPGRWLKLRLDLHGDGTVTPVVHRVRLDLPRATSADLLPAAFRQDPVADDFTERFLSLFDASLADLDRVIERYPALLDPTGTPDGLLTWLGGLLGLTYDAGWTPDVRRRLLIAAPELYRTRGTPAALAKVIEIVTGLAPDVTELAAERSWATVAAADAAPGDPAQAGSRLGLARLFGQATARLRLGDQAGAGGSPLGRAPLRSGGDPRSDALTAHAFRFRVTLPPRTSSAADEQALTELVRRQAPAHTVGTVRSGGLGLVVGVWSAVDVDTALVPLPAPVLGPVTATARSRPVRLGRSSVLHPGPHGARAGTPVRSGTAVGIQTLAW